MLKFKPGDEVYFVEGYDIDEDNDSPDFELRVHRVVLVGTQGRYVDVRFANGDTCLVYPYELFDSLEGAKSAFIYSRLRFLEARIEEENEIIESHRVSIGYCEDRIAKHEAKLTEVRKLEGITPKVDE